MWGFKSPNYYVTLEVFCAYDNDYLCVPADQWELIRDDGKSIILRRKKDKEPTR